MWQQHTQSAYVIAVSYSLSMRLSRHREISAAFLSLLHKQCATASYELSINGQLRKDGMADVTAVTELARAEVLDCVSTARKQHWNLDFIVVVASVPLPKHGNTRTVMRQLSILRASHGH